MATFRERRNERAARLIEWADKRRARSAGKFTHAHNLVKDIPFGQPILVGHHSEKRHRRTLERSDNAMRAAVQDERKGAEMASRAENIIDAADRAIYMDDPDAIERLTDKLARLERERASMKAANSIVRKKGLSADAKIAQLAELLNCKPDTAAKLLTPDMCGRLGFPSYALQNLGGTITKERNRLAILTAAKTPTGTAFPAASGDTPHDRAGLVIVAAMTTPAKSWKRPRPVWNVSGNLAFWRPLLVDVLGGSVYHGAVSFWDDPTASIDAAVLEAEARDSARGFAFEVAR